MRAFRHIKKQNNSRLCGLCLRGIWSGWGQTLYPMHQGCTNEGEEVKKEEEEEDAIPT